MKRGLGAKTSSRHLMPGLYYTIVFVVHNSQHVILHRPGAINSFCVFCRRWATLQVGVVGHFILGRKRKKKILTLKNVCAVVV